MPNFTSKLKLICVKLGLFWHPPRINRIQFIVKFWLNLLTACLFIISCTYFNNPIYGALLILTAVLISINVLIITFKRFNDMNLSGWWIFLTFIPIIGLIINYILYIIPGTKVENDYGLTPKKASKPMYILAYIFITFFVIIQSYLWFIAYFSPSILSYKLPLFW